MGRPSFARSAQDARPGPALAAAELEALVRRLIVCSDLPAREAMSEPGRPAVVLDVRVDSYRCVLIRQAEVAREAVELSPREQEIARLVAKGLPNKVIARILEISTWTVGTYLRRIFAKLAVSSRAAMVAKLAEAQSPTGDSLAHKTHRSGSAPGAVPG
jgi:DNA-binding CsgD family transcriptional regulator